jgi:hypothetical protein
MAGKIMKGSAVCPLLVLLMVLGTASGQEIADIYSSIESCDVTVDGDAAGCLLLLELTASGKVIQSQTLELDGPGTWIAQWRPFSSQEASYEVCASLLRDGALVSRRCYSFLYGGQTSIRFDVRDFYADSKGMHLSLLADDPAIADVYYMLISGNKAEYVSVDYAVPVAGGLSAPLELNHAWPLVLEKGKEYIGRVKIVELNGGQTRAFMNAFIAKDDAAITETYEDEIGASATVLGNSRVPFQGSLKFQLSQNGTQLASVEAKAPVLLTGDDETVEVSWNKTLDPGLYHLSILLLDKDGEVKDLKESVIEAKPLARAANISSVEQKKSPGAGALSVAAIVLAALLMRRKAQS